MVKGTKLYSIFHNKCPHCQEGDFFTFSNPYNLSKFDKMGSSCGVCKQDYEREPGFYYGAMYVSYAINVVWFVTTWMAITVLFPNGLSMGWTAAIMIGFGVGLMPVTYRLSRLMWINFFVNYEKLKEENKIITSKQTN